MNERVRRRRLGMGPGGEVDLPAAIARPWTHETTPQGAMGLLADRTDHVLVGAWAVAPLASEWIHHATLAVRACLRLNDLRDQVAQFPTFTEAYLVALEQVDASHGEPSYRRLRDRVMPPTDRLATTSVTNCAFRMTGRPGVRPGPPVAGGGGARRAAPSWS